MRALIIVDLQNDFLPGGALAVPDGDAVIDVVNDLQATFQEVVATQDWHPANHKSFAANHPGKRPGETVQLEGLPQILWPVHCVQNTLGAEFSSKFSLPRTAYVCRKGTDPRIDSYSGFFDNGHRKATGLADYLRQRGVTDVYVAGLATDYCVLFTALDARKLGFTTYLIQNACRGVELQAGDVSKAIDQMRRAEVKIVQSHEIRTGAGTVEAN